MRDPSLAREGTPGARLPGNSRCHKSRVPGACGHEGAAQPARVSGSGSHLGVLWSRNVTGMLFQNQPPGGARAREPCRLNWHFANVESFITYYCFSLPHSILKFRFQRCREVVWTFAVFLLPLHFCLGGRCGEEVDAAFSWGLGP